MPTGRKLIVLAGAALALAGGVVATTATASDSSAAAAIEKRQKILKALEANMKPLALIARGRAPADKAVMVKHSNAIASYAKQVGPAFKTNTTSSSIENDAKPSIWTNKADFDAKAAKFVAASNALSSASASGDASKFRSALVTVGQTCKDCHQSYRDK